MRSPLPGRRSDPFATRFLQMAAPGLTGRAPAFTPTAQGLKDALGRLPSREHVEVQRLLRSLQFMAQKSVPELLSTFFNDLIECEAYGVFVEVFNACNGYLRSQAEGNAEPFKTRLSLFMPHDWKPVFRAEMVEAFRQIQVDQLEVHATSTGNGAHAIPEAVSACVAALLHGGATELTVQGALSASAEVAHALRDSRLRSITFNTSVDETSRLGPSERESFEHLARGLVACSTLRHLGMGHSDLFALHATVAEFQQPGGPKLESVTLHTRPGKASWPVDVSGHGVGNDDAVKIEPLMCVLRQCPALVDIKVTANIVSGAAALRKAVLDPLAGHPSLTRLEIQATGTDYDFPQLMLALPVLLEFSLTCPRLTHIGWDANFPFPEASFPMNVLQASGLDFELREAATRILKIMKSPDFHLQSLTLAHMPLPWGPLRALFKGLAGNASFRTIDVSRSFLDLQSMEDLLASLRINWKVEDVLVPRDHSKFYLVSSDRTIHGFVAKEWKPGAYDGFALGVMPRMFVPFLTTAQTTFGRMRTLANTFHDVLAARRRTKVGARLLNEHP